MVVFTSDALDSEQIRALEIHVSQHYANCERSLIELDHWCSLHNVHESDVLKPSVSSVDTSGLIQSLLHDICAIRDKLLLSAILPCERPVQSALMLVKMLEQGAAYVPLQGDLLLLLLEYVKVFVRNLHSQGFTEYDPELTQALSAYVEDVVGKPAEDQEKLLKQAIQVLDPGVSEYETTIQAGNESAIDALNGIDIDDVDLQFFRTLITPIEQRSAYWQGRCNRILKMVLILNDLAGNPVDKQQLAVAVYAHDFGMAFMPLDILHKYTTLNDSEILLLRSHVQSSACLLQHMNKWQVARQIVLQHHEAVNGTGYPGGLRENEICDGAKMLAIADAFDALTHQRAYSTSQKRPVLRAVKEINDCARKQFSQNWVNVFNEAVQPVLLAYHARQYSQQHY